MLELREKARDYKTRAIEGNYFSREYLAQLDAELEQLYEEQSKNSRNAGKSERADARSRSHDKPRSPGDEDGARRNSPKGLGRRHVQRAWESEESSENIEDGKRVYRDLNEQFIDVSLDSDTSPQRDSIHGSGEQAAKKSSTTPSFRKTANQEKYSPKHSGNNRTEPSYLKKTAKPGQTIRKNAALRHESNRLEYNGRVDRQGTKTNTHKTAIIQKTSPTFHEVPPQAVRKDAPLLQSASSGNSEGESPGSEARENYKCRPSLRKTVNHEAFHGITKPTQTVQRNDDVLLHSVSSGSDASSEMSEGNSSLSGDNNPDKFNIKYVQAMHSNDYKAPSTSVRSNYDSESSRRSCDSDSFLSQPSLASRESVARQTLAHAKQRKENFW